MKHFLHSVGELNTFKVKCFFCRGFLHGCNSERITGVHVGLHCNKKLSWCWQTRAMRLEVRQGHQT